MATELAKLLAEMDGALDGDPDRRDMRDSGLDSAVSLAARLPLVHRTGRPGQTQPWPDIFKGRVLRASTAVTPEEQGCGWSNSAYFFLGCAAFPKGSVALLLKAEQARQPGVFSPFDSGALGRGFLRPADDAAPWELDHRVTHLARHSGDAGEVVAFAGPYIASHFRDPSSYVLRPQESEPDFAPYHGLQSTSGDRRAWSIEVRLQGDVPVIPGPAQISAIILSNRALEADVPDEFLDHVVLADSDGESEGDVAGTAASMILTEAAA